MNDRLLLYTEDPGVGGVAVYNHAILCYLATVGYHVTCVQSYVDNPLIEEQKLLGVQHFWLEHETMKEFTRTLYNLGDAKGIFSKVKPDLIIFSDGWPMANWAAKQVALSMNIPYIVVLGYTDASFEKFYRGDGIDYIKAVSYHYSKAKEVVAVSQENLDLLKKAFELEEGKGKVIHYGRPAQYFQPPDPLIRQRLRAEVGVPDDGVLCFTAARLTPIKGHKYQLEAIERLQKTAIWSKLYFVWAGAGSGTHHNIEPELRATIERLGVADRVKLIGQRWDIPDWLGASDIFILSSEAEGMPICVMEAMAKGLPVIASAVSGIPEELDDTGKLLPDPKVDPEGMVRELVNAIQSWATFPELRLAVGQACGRRAQKMFTEERMCREYMEVIREALSGREDFSPDLDTFVVQPNYVEDGSDFAFGLERQMCYYSLVWNGWYAYEKGMSDRAIKCLKTALKYNTLPLSPIETVLGWVKRFGEFSGEIEKDLDVYSMSNSVEWKELIRDFVINNPEQVANLK
jgi:glycosyltransferase involved in cell wall biosynthesis